MHGLAVSNRLPYEEDGLGEIVRADRVGVRPVKPDRASADVTVEVADLQPQDGYVVALLRALEVRRGCHRLEVASGGHGCCPLSVGLAVVPEAITLSLIYPPKPSSQ
jgi:hypothetical protein